MVNETFIKDLNKSLRKDTINTELTPGTPRRYEPEQGIRKHNERIHAESSFADKSKNLPFSFSKPAKNKIIRIKFCSNCGAPAEVNKNAFGIICATCKKYARLLEEPTNGGD